MLDYSSELKSENGEVLGYGILHVINQVTLNDEINCVFEESYVDTVVVV